MKTKSPVDDKQDVQSPSLVSHHCTGSCQLGQSTPHLQISGNLNIFKAAMLLFLFLLVAGQASAEGGGRVLEIKNSKGETFSYKDRVAQEKEVFDIKDRFAIIY